MHYIIQISSVYLYRNHGKFICYLKEMYNMYTFSVIKGITIITVLLRLTLRKLLWKIKKLPLFKNSYYLIVLKPNKLFL